ncbi:MAG: hypothetical protein Q9201_003591 [Fulgogasparrea decipioides]
MLSGITEQKAPEPVGIDLVIKKTNVTTIPQVLGGEKMVTGVVTANRELADYSIGTAKRHIEIRLPAGSEYRSGDYIVVQGKNPDETVYRVMKRFNLDVGDVLCVLSKKKEFMPTQPIAVEHFLRSSVELAAPITKRQLGTLISCAKEESAERTQLEKMHEDVAYSQLLDKRYSVIDILEEVPQLQLPFGIYIDLLLPLSPRLYSISSSPLEPTNKQPDGPIASLTYDVFKSPATSGYGTFHGVASTYLANRTAGENIRCLVRTTKLNFRLPSNTKQPIIMLAAGTGIAPMRAFIQERAAVKRKGGASDFGPALLFFGCRHPDKDFLYHDELARWAAEGVVEVISCFSRPDTGSQKLYVHDALWEHRERVWDLFHTGLANVYTCGSAAKLGSRSAATWRRIWMEKTGGGEGESYEWLDGIKNEERFVNDVW